MAQQSPEERIERVHTQLTQAVQGLVTGDDWVQAMAFAARFRSRSFNNTLLIWMQHQQAFADGRVTAPEPTFVAGYRQWQQLDRQVAKGQRGYVILAPIMRRYASPDPSTNQWRQLGRGEKAKVGETVRSVMANVRPAYVWDISQTEGAPIPERPRPHLLAGQAPAGLWQALAGLITAKGFELVEVPDAKALGGANGRTDYAARTVSIRADMDSAAQAKTLAHELAHVLMHDPSEDDVRAHRGIIEVEAESVALMIGAAHGMDSSAFTVPYVSAWASRADGENPVKIVQATGERVRKTALSILDQLPTTQVGDGDPPGLERPKPILEQPARQHGRPEPAQQSGAEPEVRQVEGMRL